MSITRRLLAFLLVCLTASVAFAQRSTPQQLLHPAGAAFDGFGIAVAVDGDTMIVGAALDQVGPNGGQGSAHIYRWTGTGWTWEATLTAPDGAAVDRFGISVAISGDAVLVGADSDDIGANNDQGSAYLFTRTGTTWTQQAKLTASDGAANDSFGASVALSGDTALVGASADKVGANANQGSAYIFTRSGSTWTQQAQLTASDGAAGDSFGSSVALSGDTAIVGSYQHDLGTITDQGSAYIFTRTGTTWTNQAKLTASDGAAGDFFGFSVAISGDTALVGALADAVGANANQGSAYIFTRSGVTWTQQAKLTASDGATNDLLGSSVAIVADTALVGARSSTFAAPTNPGSAYIFTRSGVTWTQQAKITAPDAAGSDRFGNSVALTWGGDLAVVGAPGDNVGANTDQGSAWVYNRVGTTWVGPDRTLQASDGAAGDNFGYAVAISGDTAVVGALFDTVGGNTEQGSASIYVRIGTLWVEQAKLVANDGAASSGFGGSVAISGNTVLIGADQSTIGGNATQGAAYVFTRTGSTWNQQAKLVAADGSAGDRFGFSVALVGDTALIGAQFDTVAAAAGRGSAYVFTRSGTNWTQQTQLLANDGAAGDRFGYSVALGGPTGDTALIGARLDDVGLNTNQGSAYVFTRTGATWSPPVKLTAFDGAANDNFGSAVALDETGNTALIGVPGDDVGPTVDLGSATFFTRSGTVWTQGLQFSGPPLATGAQFGNSVALSGNSAVVGAWLDDAGGNVDRGSASYLTRLGTNWLRQLTLTGAGGAAGDNFGTSVAVSNGIVLIGTPLDDVGAAADRGSISTFDLPADDFSFVRNDTTNFASSAFNVVLNGAGLGHQITATEAAWRTAGPVNTGGNTFTLRSSGDLRYPSTDTLRLGSTSSLSSAVGNRMEIYGTLNAISLANAAVNTDDFTLGSRGQITVLNSSALTITSPIITLAGTTTLGTGSPLTLAGNARVAGTTTAGAGATLSITGRFDCPIDDNARYNLRQATLRMNGPGPEQTLEVMSTDIGPDIAGLDRTIAGHYPIGTLRIGPSAAVVRLVDVSDNDNLGAAACEAIYVDTLQVDAGARLINPSCKIYYNTLINNGTIDVPANVIPYGPPCAADFNGDGFLDFTDFDDFVTAFEAGNASSDFNGDGFLDFTDFDDFVTAFEAGC